ncbi:VIT family protein [Nostoc ellipsosporum NOK]|nr:VIT family protein [Nostoc ellipsosporum NOK]
MTRVGWLRAAVLGANDGILSTASVAIGVAAASTGRYPVVIAALSALVAGALSMAAGEYVSVSSQADLEKSDLKRERQELADMPEEELHELAGIYEGRGLSPELALQVAQQLTNHNALEAHARDELGINDFTKAKPLEAALASAASFIVGGACPLLLAFFAPLKEMVWIQYVASTIFLVMSGWFAAYSGGAPILRSVVRIVIWGTIAMCFTALVGYLFGTQVA